METVQDIPLSDIFSDDEFNCRGTIAPMSVMELSQDIARNGLVQPIVIQPWKGKPGEPGSSAKYRIVVGHRRFLAFRVLKKESIPAIVREGLSEQSALVMNIAENVQRQDLNIVQEARAVQRLSKLGWTDARIARELSVYPEWVRTRLELLNLDDAIQDRAAAGFLTAHQINDICALTSRDAQLEMTRRCVDHKLRGERGSFKVKADPKRALKKGDPRGKEEIFELQEVIQDSLEDNKCFAARCLAWAAGILSDEEIYGDLAAICRSQGKKMRRPEVKFAADD